MVRLDIGDNLTLSFGGYAKIQQKLFSDKERDVYLVDIFGKKMLLKWFFKPQDDQRYEYIRNRILTGAPSSAFIWPENITNRERGSFGYVERVYPGNYCRFSRFLLGEVAFKNYSALMAAAINVCNCIRMLHSRGFTCFNICDRNLFFDPDSGDLLVNGQFQDKNSPVESWINGKTRYMAPEIIAGGVPDKNSDRYSLAVILFMLFYAGHPLEGAKVLACPLMSETEEKRFYGTEPLFIFDRYDKSNFPVDGVHDNVIHRWPLLPEKLREIFIEEFSHDKLKDPSRRMVESVWEKVLTDIRDSLVCCNTCGRETFITPTCECMHCSSSIIPPMHLKFGNRSVPIMKGTKIYAFNDNNPVAEIKLHPHDSSALLMQNISPSVWKALTPTGKKKLVRPSEHMPVRHGIRIEFDNACVGEFSELKI